MTGDLKEACKRILERLQRQDVEEYGCVLCSQHVRGQDALMQHLITEHEVHCLHFDNVIDLPRFLKRLTELLHQKKASPTHWVCPVCSYNTESRDVDALQRHISSEGHQHWNAQTIPSLAPECVSALPPGALGAGAVDGNTASAVAADVEAAEDGNSSEWSESGDEEVDEDEDWNLSCVCLYCEYCGEDVLEHLKSAHAFDFRSRVRQHQDIKDVYDLVRVVNLVRRAVGSDRCPYGEDCVVDGKANDHAFLEEHLHANANHRLPQHVSRSSDTDLIPVLPGDAFLSMVVTSGEGFMQMEEEDPDFPMVPTVQELVTVAASRANHRTA